MKKLFLPLLLICGLGARVLSAELTVNPPAQGNRFLFVVDTSLSMNRSAKAVRETVHELIESGMQGQMQPGDTFGLWTFNEQLNPEFPMQRWTPGEEKNSAQLAVDFLKSRRYEKKSQLHTALPPLYSVIKSSKAITVILISNGNEPIQGTPFDKEINAIYPNYVRELHEAKLAFVTILVGRNGKPVDYSVNSSFSPIRIPQWPIEQEKIAPLAKTNAVPSGTNHHAAPKPKTVAPSVTKPETKQSANPSATTPAKAETKPEIKTRDVAALASTNISTPITAPKIEISAPVVPSNSATLSDPQKIEPQKIANESSVTTTVQRATSPTAQPDLPIKTEPARPPDLAAISNAALSKNLAATNSEGLIRDRATQATASANSALTDLQPQTSTRSAVTPSEVADEDPSTFEPQAQKAAVKSISTSTNSSAPAIVATQSVFTSKKLLAAGTALLLVASILVFLLLRHSRKSQPSLISRSINQSK